MGFHTTGNSSTSRRTTQAVNLGYLRNRIASTTRKFNYCKEHSANPSLCINQFVNIAPQIQSNDGSLQVIVATSGSVFTSNDYGVNFTQYDISGNPPLTLIKTSYDGNYKVAIDINDNYLYLFSNNTWRQNSNQFLNIDISSDGKYQTATNYLSGSLFRSTDYGNNWSSVSDVEFAITVSLSSSGQQQVAACAVDVSVATVFKSNNYGVTWTQTNIVSDEYTWICANISGDGSIITAGSLEGVIQYSRNNGATWTEATINWSSTPFVGSICSSYNGQYQAFISFFILDGGVEGFIYLSTDGGITWNPANVPELFYTSIAISNSGKFISAIANNDDGSYYYYKSDNYGQTFEEIPYEDTPILGIDIN